MQLFVFRMCETAIYLNFYTVLWDLIRHPLLLLVLKGVRVDHLISQGSKCHVGPL